VQHPTLPAELSQAIKCAREVLKTMLAGDDQNRLDSLQARIALGGKRQPALALALSVPVTRDRQLVYPRKLVFGSMLWG
jgi:hypothetical protein